MDLKKWDDVIRINVTAAMLLSQAFVSEHVSLTASSIVFVGSVMSLVGQPAKSSYCASKAALVGLTKSLALELAKEKKRVNLICPGMVETELLQEFRTLVGPEKMEAFEKLHPLGFGSTRDVSHAVAYLISDASRWITGTSLVVDGGFTAA
jgi:NAD(P)-dependent dehydrogenase (short-subunit alcohol dehydrogenase family)